MAARDLQKQNKTVIVFTDSDDRAMYIEFLFVTIDDWFLNSTVDFDPRPLEKAEDYFLQHGDLLDTDVEMLQKIYETYICH